MSRRSFSRRSILLWLPLTIQTWSWPSGAQQAPLDQGIGGTGLSRTPTNGLDQGIGGTGVIGTIRRFGSIVVNGLRIAYGGDAQVMIDGRTVRQADMKIGHVATAIARTVNGTLTTSQIIINSEVIGPLERASGSTWKVLGQTVDMSRIPASARPAGHGPVAVFGRRRTDGVIVASRVEDAAGRAEKVIGPVQYNQDGRLAVGSLLLRGVPPSFVGRRASLEGTLSSGELVVTRATDESKPFTGGVSRVVVEDYVDPRSTLPSGAGYALNLPPGAVSRPGLNILTGIPTAAGPLAISGGRSDPASEGRSPAQSGPSGGRAGPGNAQTPNGRNGPDVRGGGGGSQLPQQGPRPGYAPTPNSPPGNSAPGAGGPPGGFGGPGGSPGGFNTPGGFGGAPGGGPAGPGPVGPGGGRR